VGRGFRPRRRQVIVRPRRRAQPSRCCTRTDSTDARLRDAVPAGAQLPTVNSTALRRVTCCDDGRVCGALACEERSSGSADPGGRVLLRRAGWAAFSRTRRSDVPRATGWRQPGARRGGERPGIHSISSDGAARGGAPRFLLSEALRGEGAYLLNSKATLHGAVHPLKELGRRVSRAIVERHAARRFGERSADPRRGFVKQRFRHHARAWRWV